MIKQTGPATPGTSVEKVHLGCRLNVALIILRASFYGALGIRAHLSITVQL